MRIRSFGKLFSIVLAVVLFGGAPAFAQEPTDSMPPSQAPSLASLKVGPDISPSPRVQRPVRLELRPVNRRRPAALIPLYGSLVALQGLDIHSTRRGMSSGRTREANPLMGHIVDNDAALFAVKAAVTTAAIWSTEKLWKKSPKRAVLVAAILNTAMAAVVAHNYRVAK